MILLTLIILISIIAIYGTIDMWKQTNKSKMIELDLHGLKHLEVEGEVENFILSQIPPFRIITGKSEEMRRMVKNMLDYYEYVYYIPAHNAGEIIVTQ